MQLSPLLLILPYATLPYIPQCSLLTVASVYSFFLSSLYYYKRIYCLIDCDSRGQHFFSFMSINNYAFKLARLINLKEMMISFCCKWSWIDFLSSALNLSSKRNFMISPPSPPLLSSLINNNPRQSIIVPNYHLLVVNSLNTSATHNIHVHIEQQLYSQ